MKMKMNDKTDAVVLVEVLGGTRSLEHCRMCKTTAYTQQHEFTIILTLQWRHCPLIAAYMQLLHVCFSEPHTRSPQFQHWREEPNLVFVGHFGFGASLATCW